MGLGSGVVRHGLSMNLAGLKERHQDFSLTRYGGIARENVTGGPGLSSAPECGYNGSESVSVWSHAMSATATLMTTEELLALPENGMDRWLIAGELREKPMPTRNRFHSRVMTRSAQHLANWNDTQPPPRGSVLTGDAGVRLQQDPDTTFGVDVMYVSAAVMARQTPQVTIIEGVPTLTVEILSPSDKLEEVHEKIDAFLAAGVALVWIIDTHLRTVTVHRPGAAPELFNIRQELSGDPHLPGLRIPVARLFD
jgi:Uma2 family endonuclease